MSRVTGQEVVKALSSSVIFFMSVRLTKRRHQSPCHVTSCVKDLTQSNNKALSDGPCKKWKFRRTGSAFTREQNAQGHFLRGSFLSLVMRSKWHGS